MSVSEGKTATESKTDNKSAAGLSLTAAGRSNFTGSRAKDFSSEDAEAMIREYINLQHKMRMDTKGAFSGKHLLQVLSTMGMEANEEDIRHMVVDWESITVREAAETVTTVRVTQNMDLYLITKKLESTVVVLGPWDYLKYKFGCLREKAAELEYKTVKFAWNISPRQMLFASTGVVLLITGMAILALMSVLWLQQANEREKVQLKNFHVLLASFAESFENRFVQAHGESMVDQISTLAKMIEKETEFTESVTLDELQEEARKYSEILNITFLGSEERELSAMTGTFESMSSFFADDLSGALTENDIVALATGWKHEFPGWETVLVKHSSVLGGMPQVLLRSQKIECSYGPCEYQSVPCLQLTNGEVKKMIRTQDVHREFVSAVTVSLPPFNITICSTRPMEMVEAAKEEFLRRQIAKWNVINADKFLFQKEIIVVQMPEDPKEMRVNWKTEKLRPVSDCYSFGTDCLALDATARVAHHVGYAVSRRGYGYSGRDLLIGAAPVEHFPNFVVLISLQRAGFLEKCRNQIIEIINFLNFNTDRSTELSVGRVDPKTSKVNAQINKFRFVNDCYGECQRYPASAVSAVAALTEGTTGWLITPDYRPAPVIGARAIISYGLDLALVIERDVVEVRGLGLDALVAILDENNVRYTGSLEAQLVRQRGMPPSKTFDSADSCEKIKECISIAPHGVVYRSDCVHCLMTPVLDTFELEYLTKLKNFDQCVTARRNCSQSALWHDKTLAYAAIQQQNLEAIQVSADDYRFEKVQAVYNFIQNFSVSLIVKLDKKEIEGPITAMVALAVGIAIAIVLTGLTLLIFFSRKILDKIELEWRSYKEQIDAERSKFNIMVKDIIPKCLADQVAKDGKHSFYFPNLTYAFVDIVNLSEKTKNWSPDIVCRYLTYVFTVVEKTAFYFQLNKVKLFGDTYFGVGGLEANAATQSLSRIEREDKCEKAALMAAHFGAVMVQLLSNKFAHYPHRIDSIRLAFEDVTKKHGFSFPDAINFNPEDLGHVVMPQMRIGMHYGPGTCCVIETGRTPAFEVFSKGVALTARMQTTSQGNKIHLTADLKDVIERVDMNHQFEFDAPRKTVVKTQGSITSFFVKSAYVPVPGEVLEALGVEYANLRVFYQRDE